MMVSVGAESQEEVVNGLLPSRRVQVVECGGGGGVAGGGGFDSEEAVGRENGAANSHGARRQSHRTVADCGGTRQVVA